MYLLFFSFFFFFFFWVHSCSLFHLIFTEAAQWFLCLYKLQHFLQHTKSVLKCAKKACSLLSSQLLLICISFVHALCPWSLVLSLSYLAFFLHITWMLFPWNFLYWHGQEGEIPTCSCTLAMSLHTMAFFQPLLKCLFKYFSCSYFRYPQKAWQWQSPLSLNIPPPLLSFTYPASTKARNMGWCRGRGYFMCFNVHIFMPCSSPLCRSRQHSFLN